jgi:hypothetical protein
MKFSLEITPKKLSSSNKINKQTNPINKLNKNTKVYEF